MIAGAKVDDYVEGPVKEWHRLYIGLDQLTNDSLVPDPFPSLKQETGIYVQTRDSPGIAELGQGDQRESSSTSHHQYPPVGRDAEQVGHDRYFHSGVDGVPHGIQQTGDWHLHLLCRVGRQADLDDEMVAKVWKGGLAEDQSLRDEDLDKRPVYVPVYQQ